MGKKGTHLFKDWRVLRVLWILLLLLIICHLSFFPTGEARVGILESRGDRVLPGVLTLLSLRLSRSLLLLAVLFLLVLLALARLFTLGGRQACAKSCTHSSRFDAGTLDFTMRCLSPPHSRPSLYYYYHHHHHRPHHPHHPHHPLSHHHHHKQRHLNSAVANADKGTDPPEQGPFLLSSSASSSAIIWSALRAASASPLAAA